MASEDADIDEMDSLFEGMVLFDPSQVPAVPIEQPNPNTDNNDVDDEVLKQQNHQSDSILSPPSPVAESSSSSRVSQPLDENLFSDLTLITPPPQTLELEQPPSDPSPTITATATTSNKSISRQISTTRKKKRAAGLRIGYKKDDVESDPQPQSSPLPPPEEIISSKIEKSPQQVADTTAATGIKIEIDLVQDNDVQEPVAEAIQEEEPRNSSIELKFEQIKITITENLKSARELVASISATRKESIKRRRNAAENLSLASTRYRELEKELEEACEAEDFETADRLSESLASADSEKELLAVALRDADVECDAVDSKMQQVLDLQIAAEEEGASLLQGFATVSIHRIFLQILLSRCRCISFICELMNKFISCCVTDLCTVYH